jgi:hypothetical protein
MKFTSILTVFTLALVLVFTGAAQADTIGTMPVLYNASGQAVNTSGGVLPAGTYYLGTGSTQPVTYFGDGSFYNAATRMYGGSVFNPTGAAGTFTIPAAGEAPAPTPGTGTGTGTGSVGVPNTGMGGEASLLWAVLGLSAVAGVAGASYLARGRHAAK